MPLDETAPTTITGFSNVPSFAHGRVRDLRVRWALSEIGRPYRAELLDAFKPRPQDYRQWQPFGQVPAFDDGQTRLFESGAILLYLGEQDERLLPREHQARWQTITWLIAALNSVEPALMNVAWLGHFHAGKPWAENALPAAIEFANARLSSLAAALGDREWVAADRFTLADIMMVTVLRNVDGTDILDRFPGVAAYKARGEARPAFRQALEKQLAGFASAEMQPA